MITLTGDINVDMNDVKTVMRDSGAAIMGAGAASGEGRAMIAVTEALESPLLNDSDITGANFVLLNITYGSEEVLMDEISEITDYIQDQAGATAEVIWGYGHDASLDDKICVTVIATGFEPTGHKPQGPTASRMPLDMEVREIKAPLSGPMDPVLSDLSETHPIEPHLKTDVQDPMAQPGLTQQWRAEDVTSTTPSAALDPSVHGFKGRGRGSTDSQGNPGLGGRADHTPHRSPHHTSGPFTLLDLDDAQDTAGPGRHGRSVHQRTGQCPGNACSRPN